MMRLIPLAGILLTTCLLASCNLEKEVDIDLPDHMTLPVVEAYLEPGKPYRLLLTRSFGYFDDLDFGDPAAALIQGASVVIRHAGMEVVLDNQLYVDPVNFHVANYGSPELVPDDLDHPFELEIILPDGHQLTATTRLLPSVAIDSLIVEYNADSMARVLTFFTESPSETNFYRRILQFGASADSTLQDFVVKDDFFQTDKGVFGTGYAFRPGDTLHHTLIHLDKAGYDYMNTVNQSVNANLNPFGQPGLIVSNIQGTRTASGIFTGLRPFRVMLILP